jgi:hypothetical protein
MPDRDLAPRPAPDLARSVGILRAFEEGSVEVTSQGVRLLRLDARQRELELDLGMAERLGGGSAIRSATPSLFGLFRWAHALHAAGWRLVVRDGERPFLKLGAGANPLFGYVHLEPRALRGLPHERGTGPI